MSQMPISLQLTRKFSVFDRMRQSSIKHIFTNAVGPKSMFKCEFGSTLSIHTTQWSRATEQTHRGWCKMKENDRWDIQWNMKILLIGKQNTMALWRRTKYNGSKRIFGVMNSLLAQLYHNIELPAYQHMKHCTWMSLKAVKKTGRIWRKQVYKLD